MKDGETAPARLFFAAIPDAAACERIAACAAAAAMRLDSEVRWVPRVNYHLTLAFIGAVPAGELSVVRDIGSAIRAAAFAVRFDAYEYWPKPELVVAAARTVPAELQRLWQRLHVDLAVHRWAVAPKALRPHVTLARKVSQAPVLQALSAFEWRVREFCLMRSDTRDGASVYTVVDTWSLLDGFENP